MITFMHPLQSPFRYKALSTDEKPTDATYGSMLLEEDTGVWYIFYGEVWSVASTSSFDPSSGTLTIYHDVPELDVQPWDSYASDVKSLVIQDNVTIGNGAFDTLTALEYLKIGEGVSLGSGVFGVDFEDYAGDGMSSVGSGDYVGAGDGTLYSCDPSIFTYNAAGSTITGLVNAASVVNLVIPNERNGVRITSTFASAFKDNTAITAAWVLPGSNLESMGNGTFQGCTSLARVTLPHIATIPNFAFHSCTALTEISIPSTVTAINMNAFYNAGLTEISIPSTVTTIGANVFKGCTSITSVSFGDGFSASLGNDWAYSWTFYETDGTTAIDKTVASNLAGKTFHGVYNALVEVAPGQLSLTPDQLQQVQLHTQELQDLKDHLTIDPLPFQPSLQTEQEQVVGEPEEPAVEEGSLDL